MVGTTKQSEANEPELRCRMGLVIGIDLGTTNSLVAYMKDGQPVIVPSLQGEALTPSVVTFADDDRRWVGQLAKTQAQANPLQNASPVEWFAGQTCPDGTGLLTVVSSIKRQMGSDHVVEVGGQAYTPAEISAMILEKLKADAETYLGEPVERAVITVPAYFNNSQRMDSVHRLANSNQNLAFRRGQI